jgi:hypothetical protein
MKIDKVIVAFCASAVAVLTLAAGSGTAGAQTDSRAIGEPAVVPEAIDITAILIEERCLGGDAVEVTLSGMGNSSSPAEFAWDFTNNGSIDTGVLTNPRVVQTYPDEVNVTAELFARNDEGQMDSDTITFATLRCE